MLAGQALVKTPTSSRLSGSPLLTQYFSRGNRLPKIHPSACSSASSSDCTQTTDHLALG